MKPPLLLARAMVRRLLLALACLAAAPGCSLLVSFPDDAQLCDPSVGSASQQCLPGFRCVAGHCVHAADAGADGGGP